MDLSTMSAPQLRELQEQVAHELKKREQEGFLKAREQILAIAEGIGMPLKDLMTLQGRLKQVKSGTRYRHPSNPTLQWGGRGRKPGWIKDWLASGQSLEALSV